MRHHEKGAIANQRRSIRFLDYSQSVSITSNRTEEPLIYTELICGSVSGAAARRRAQVVVFAPDRRVTNAAAPDGPRRTVPEGEPTAFVDMP